MKRYNILTKALAGIWLCYLTASCSTTPGDQFEGLKRERYSINPDATTECLKSSEYSIDSIRSLNIPDDIIEMGLNKKISVINGNVYILDTEITKKLYIFDYKGNLKTIIGERGHARGEFIGKPDDFFVDGNDKVHVFDRIGHRINVFDKDGSLDDVIETSEFYPHSIGLTSNDKYMMYFNFGHKDKETDSKSSLLLLDNKCKEYEKLMPSEGDLCYMVSGHTFFQDKERLSFIPSFSDSIFVFKNDTFEKIVSFDFGEKILCKEMPEKLQGEDPSFMFDYQGVFGLLRYQETDALILLEYIYQNCGRFWLYNKRNGQAISALKFFEGIDPYSYYCLDGKQIIAYVSNKLIEDFRKFYGNKKFQEDLEKSPQEIKDLLEGRIKAPALVYITLK